MATEQDYINLNARRDALVQQHAVLTDREKAKAERRTEIIAQLKEAGIDPDRPQEEIARLEAESEESYKKAKAAIAEFEAALNGQGEQAPEAAPKPQPVVDDFQPAVVDTDDIDI